MPLRNRHILVSLILILSFVRAGAQESDSLSVPSNELNRPQLEMGVGHLSYFGDVGNLNGIGQSSVLNWGYHLSLRNPISESVGLNVFAMFGKIRANERLVNGNADFETKIRMGGIALTYNFSEFLPENRSITPYVSLGFSTFEFAPKADLFDAEGNRYHYWNDGSIRVLPQSSPEANPETTQRITRDYHYETDLRESREKGDQYNLRGFTMPIGAGVDLEISPAFTLKMGAEYHLSFTDNIDNINPEFSPSSSQKKGNDHFLYSSLGISYNLKYKKPKTKGGSAMLDKDLLAIEFADEDGDGVADIIDQCPFTPKGVEIDQYGCPIDEDQDGVPDYRDLELSTPKGERVNSDGVALTDEDYKLMYDTYKDSLGNLSFEKSQTYTADAQRRIKMGERSKGYRIKITDSSDLSADEIALLLSIPEIKSIEEEGVTTYYLGDYQSLTEALSQKSFLNEIGLESEVFFYEFGKTTRITDQEANQIASIMNLKTIDNSAITFRVQIGAFRYKLSGDVFNDVPDLLIIEGNDGLTRYVSGSFKTLRNAAEHKIELLLKGFEGAFVTAYRDGKRITLKEAGATTTAKEDISGTRASGNINKEFVKFTVQLGSFNGRVPASVLSSYMKLENVRPVRGDNGTTKYVFGQYNSAKEASAKLPELRSKGFEDAFVVGEFNGKIIQAQEAEKIKEN